MSNLFSWFANLFNGNTSGNGSGASTAGVHIPATSSTQISNNVTGLPTSSPISSSTPQAGFSPNATQLFSGNGAGEFNLNLPSFPNISSGLGKIGEFVLPYMDALSGKASVDEAKREYDQNMEFAKEEQAYQHGIDAQNQANIDREFEYQKYLNENQTQISARDAQLAGINPLAMKGNTVSSTSGTVSSGSSAPQGDGAVAQALGVQGSQLLGLGQQLLGSAQNIKQRKSAEKIAREGLENTLAIAQMSDATTLLNLYNQAIDCGIHPDLILKKLGVDDKEINKPLTIANRMYNVSKAEIAAYERIEQSEKGTFKGRAQDLAENEFKLKDPSALIEALGISDKSSDVIKSVLAILRMLI